MFPYSQDFENNDGGWIRNSSLHWEWGAIVPGTKPIIAAAGGGQKCWVVGGLSGSNYASGTSYLQSPCFDFSSLVNPEISFKIIWETEYTYDGVSLEYSIDQGATWSLLGSENSNANCQGVNWYNTSSVRFIGYTNGWSGSVLRGSSGNCQSGNGSGQWLNARHNLSLLAGKSKVIFRFSFGSGLICNDYDGFAFDDFSIKEALPSAANFNYTCNGNNSVSFTNIASLCQTSVQWNFGDPSSGSANISNLENPSHTFSAPGTYTVTQTVRFSNSASPSTKSQQIIILDVNPVITQPLLCNGDHNGVITANVSGGNLPYTFNWNTSPAQSTQTITNLYPGTYTLSVSCLGSCTASSSVSLIEPSSVDINVNVTNATCGQRNGEIISTVSGGTGIYTYLWSNGESTASINNVSSGTYSLTVTDAHSCVANENNIIVRNNIIPANVFLGNDTTICKGETLLLHAGNFSSYLWQDNSTSPTYLVTQTGTYDVSVVNSAGCSGSDAIKVIVECKGVFFPSSFTPNDDGLNDLFGPIGDVGNLKDYSLSVYNRWGQRLFVSSDPFVKWNGKFKSVAQETQTLIWIASFKLYNNSTQFKKGTITLLR